MAQEEERKCACLCVWCLISETAKLMKKRRESMNEEHMMAIIDVVRRANRGAVNIQAADMERVLEGLHAFDLTEEDVQVAEAALNLKRKME